MHLYIYIVLAFYTGFQGILLVKIEKPEGGKGEKKVQLNGKDGRHSFEKKNFLNTSKETRI